MISKKWATATVQMKPLEPGDHYEVNLLIYYRIESIYRRIGGPKPALGQFHRNSRRSAFLALNLLAFTFGL